MGSITIVIPAYNAAETLSDTIRSVFNQSYSDWELIIVDDGSTDETLNLAKKLTGNDERVKVLHQGNRGSAGAYNLGVTAAQTEWICICSADDLLLPDHLKTIVDSIALYPTFDVFTTSEAKYLLSSGKIKNEPSTPLDGTFHEEKISDVARRGLYGVGATYKRSMFIALGGYTEHIYSEDHDFWLRAFAAGYRFMHVYSSTSIFRISDNQKSADNDRVIKSQEEIVARVLAGKFENEDIKKELIEGAAARKAETDAYYEYINLKGFKLFTIRLKSRINNCPKVVSLPLRWTYHLVKKVMNRKG